MRSQSRPADCSRRRARRTGPRFRERRESCRRLADPVQLPDPPRDDASIYDDELIFTAPMPYPYPGPGGGAEYARCAQPRPSADELVKHEVEQEPEEKPDAAQSGLAALVRLHE